MMDQIPNDDHVVISKRRLDRVIIMWFIRLLHALCLILIVCHLVFFESSFTFLLH